MHGIDASGVGVRHRRTGDEPPPALPPAFYRADLWRAGSRVVRGLPAWLVDRVCVGLGAVCFHLDRRGRKVVAANLLPVLSGDRSAAQRAAGRLYRRFAVKLADLLRLENGETACQWITNPKEREVIETATARGRGVLFLTPHLGNWEHGGLLLADFGLRLTVLTLGEPEDELTAARAASRARLGMETLVIGHDSFALVEVVKRLNAGAAMAIAIDRPAGAQGVRVEWFGQPFQASAVAVELARASGCALVGVTFVRRHNSLVVSVLPEFTYDRRALGGREARRHFTQQILRAFEPAIRDHPDQWYHFVPLWAGSEAR